MFVVPVCAGFHMKSAAGKIPVPPAGVTVISPSVPPLQDTGFIVKLPKLMAIGSVNKTVIVSSHELASVTVTTYLTPPDKFVAILSTPTCVITPVGHAKLYPVPGVPPVADARTLPSVSPAQSMVLRTAVVAVNATGGSSNVTVSFA